MIERILTLAASHFPRDSEGNISATPEMITEFAELIVLECVEQVWYTREDGINGNVSQVIKDRIKEHFGVE